MTNAPATSPMSRAQISRAISLFLMFGFSQLAGPSVDPLRWVVGIRSKAPQSISLPSGIDLNQGERRIVW